MPELPEVETIKRDLIQKVIGQTITGVRVKDSRIIRNCTERHFKRKVIGQTIRGLSRRGKAIIIAFGSGRFLVVQLMMTGQLIYKSQDRQEPTTKVTFRLSNGHYLNYNDQRLFGRLNVVENLREIKYFQTVGPEPLSRQFNTTWLKQALMKRSVPIKTLLLNHQFVAGIGNIYANEILFRSQIHPRKSAQKLSDQEIDRLQQMTVKVLKEAIKFRGTTMLNYRDGQGRQGSFINRLKVYGREDQSCRRCHFPIERIVQSGRSTFFCQRCQS